MNCENLEVYLSGYIDGELTQQQAQKVELHLAVCTPCRDLLDQLKEAKEAARQIEVHQPGSREWSLVESRLIEQGARGIGWVILIIWSVLTAGYATYLYAISPQALLTRILVFGLFLGMGLIFLSVLLQRRHESRTDRYKGVLR